MSRIFHWDAPKSKAASEQACSIEGHHLVVRRTRKGAKEFTGILDGKDLLWTIDNIEDAKEALEKHYNLHFAEYQRLD